MTIKKKHLRKKVKLEISAGHLLVVWDILANQLTDHKAKAFMDTQSSEERRAIMALEDLCEVQLGKFKKFSVLANEYEALLLKAKEHVNTLPVAFLEPKKIRYVEFLGNGKVRYTKTKKS